MSAPLRLLLVEDSADDAALLVGHLARAGYEAAAERVETADDFRAALDRQAWDLVISAYVLPGFNAPAALEVLKAAGHDLPFLIVSGAVGEEDAVAAMRAGAHDYLRKDNLARLGVAIDRELREAAGRRERRKAEQALRDYQAQLRSLASELSLAEERQRRLLAATLHDGVCQTLALATNRLTELRARASAAGLGRPLDDVHDLLSQAIREARSLIFQISCPILYDLGLEPALEWLAEQVQAQYGLQARFDDDRAPKPLDVDVRVILYQAARELLINVAKHAGTRAAHLSVWLADDQVLVSVRDDGVGFDAEALAGRTTGFGLFSIRERLGYLGGRVEIASRPGQGTCVTLAAPVRQDGSREH